MSTNTPSQELFRELTDISGLIVNMLTGPNVKVKRWPPYYQIYLAMDRLCSEVRNATNYLARPPMDDATARAHRIADANYCFSRIGGQFRICVDLLAFIHQWDLVEHGQPALKNIAYNHLSPKSAWYMASHDRYCAGQISADGLLFSRTPLIIDPHPTYRVNDIDDKQLAPSQTFYLSSEQARAELVVASKQVHNNLTEVYVCLGSFFVAHCTSVRELLHPSSI
jgi:hypothetical protein